MKNSIPVKMFVLALSITNIFCFGQQNRSPVCQLGEIKNDSILPYIQALEINCAAKDLEMYSKKSAQLSSLKNIIFKGDASETEWTKVFKEIKSRPSIKQVAFIENTFESLPAGYENLFSVEQISFIGNDNLDYSTLIQQLSTLPNLTDLTMDIVTIFDVPTNLNDLKNIQHVTLINSDESVSKNETELFAVPKEPITYDYYLDKGNKKYAALKYTAAAGEIDSDEYKELSKRFATTLNFGDATTTFAPKYVNVKPPIKGIDVERTNYTLNPTIENIITYPSGTKILIPANSFTDKNGEQVSESVILSYREFRDPVDFLVSGIPMKYDTGGTVTNFESAGMFEITASIKNEPLKLAPDKKIDMNFASTSKDSTYNFYSFNDSAGNWNYLNKPKTVTSATKIKFRNPTRGFLQYQYLSQNPANIYDSTKFEERFESNKHLYTSIKDTANRCGLTYRKGGKDHHRALRSLVKISNVRKTKEGDVLFKVTYLDYAHPELREFNNMYFALNENMTTTEFRQKYVRRKYYNDVRVYTNGGDIDFKFKDSKSINDISATMVVLDDKGNIKDAKDLSTRMKKYNRRLKSREREFDKKLAKGKTERNIIRITDPKQLSVYAFKTAQQYMTAEEKKMNYDEWLTYYKQVKTEQEQQILEQAKYTAESNKVQLAKLDVSAANAQNLIQSLSIGGMGIYNCDQIQRMKNPVKVFANYKTIDENKLKPKAAYVIDKHANSVFQYDGYSGFNANKIAFDKDVKAENTLLAINEDGSIAVYSVDDFKKNDFRNRERFDFMVIKINSKFTTVAELKTLIGF